MGYFRTRVGVYCVPKSSHIDASTPTVVYSILFYVIFDRDRQPGNILLFLIPKIKLNYLQ